MRIPLAAAMLMLPLIGVSAQTPIDQHTTFMASFEESLRPDFCVGDWRAASRGEAELVEGKLGKALALGVRRGFTYNADGKINLPAGTIEFWLRWTEDLAGPQRRSIMGFVTSKQGNYVNFNKIAANRLGMPVKGGPKDDFTWQRVDVDPTGWELGLWHHLAGTWEGGVTRLYVDGKLVSERTGGAGLIETPTAFSVGPGPLVIDELRISSVARSADEIAKVANATAGTTTALYLTSLEPAGMQQAVGVVGLDHQTAIDDREMPLVIGQRAFARGIAIRAPGYVEFGLPAGVARLVGRHGLSPFGRAGASANLIVSLDGRETTECADLAAKGGAQPLSVDLKGSQRLRVEARVARDQPGAIVVIGDAMLMAADIEPPPSFSREMAQAELTIQQMRTQVAEYQFELPETSKGYVVYAGHPADEVNPGVEPLGRVFPERLRMQASPGEYEAVQFTVCAAKDIEAIRVTAGGLRSGEASIPDSRVSVYLVRRVLQRKGYWKTRQPTNYETISRFLFPNRPFWLPQGNFKEVHVLVHVPDDAKPGDYRGTIRMEPPGLEATEMALSLTVHPIQLVQPKHKRYGMYYRLGGVVEKPETMHAEFADMAAHGCTMIKGHAAIDFGKDEDGSITWDFSHIRTMLEVGREHGFFGEITVYDNLPRLAPLMGHKGLNKEGEGEPVAGKDDLLDVATRCFADLKKLERKYPEYEFLLTHMDEVFGRGRLARYLDYAEVLRKTSDFRIYITMHTRPGAWEPYIERADPWIDVRCHNGHSLETWLHAGNTWEDFAKILTDAGDDGWIYHNMRGAFFRAEWNRFINGLFMWVSPLEVHVPWMYYSYGGSAFDDTDSDRFDFGYAFPNPDDRTQMLSTLHYEAFREGCDDIRYIATLEQAIAKAKARGVGASAARAWLAQIKALLPQLPQDIKDINVESPYTVAATRRFSGADYDTIRGQTARHIIALQARIRRAAR